MKFEANIPSYLKTGSGSFPVGDTGVSKRKKPTNFYEQAQQGFELSTTTEDIQQIYSPQGMTSKIEPNFFKSMQADMGIIPNLPKKQPISVMPVGSTKTYDTEGTQKYSNPEFWQDEIKEIIESFTRTEGMKTAIGPFNMTYLLNSYDQFLDHGGNPEIAKQLQKDIQNFINTYTESFKALPEDKKKQRQDSFKKDVERYKGDFPGIRYDKPGAEKPVIEKEASLLNENEDIFIG